MQSEMDLLLGQQSRIGIAKSEMELLSLDFRRKSSFIVDSSRSRIDNGTICESELSQLGMPHCRFRSEF